MTSKLSAIRWISRVAILLLLVLFLMPLYSVKAEGVKAKTYVALGDSIAYGMDADSGKSYVDLFYNYIKSIKQYSDIGLSNLSYPGDTSTDLIKKIISNQDLLKKADIITISIGGNNITNPVIAGVCKLFNVNYVNNPDFAAELSTAIKEDPDAQIKLLFLLYDQDFQASLSDGLAVFSSDWTTIVGKIKALAPKAEVYVTTVYNPFDKSDPFYPLFDLLIQKINRIIKAPNPSYRVVDVYDEFNKYQNQSPINFNYVGGILGIHPNNIGHEIIFKAHKRLVIIPVDSITLDNESKNLVPGSTLKLNYTISPSNATNTEVIWVSSNAEVASVDMTGNITAKIPGTVIIKATMKDGSKTAACSINITVPVDSILLNNTSEKISLNSELQLTAVISPSNASNKNVIWKSSDEGIAAVDANGRVKGLKPGTATITVTSVDVNKTAACFINVTVPVDSIFLNKTSEKIGVEKELQLIATISPSNASNKDVIWKSSDEEIAVVDVNGKVKGLKPGTTTITVTSVDENKTAACQVTVTRPLIDFPILISIGITILISGTFLIKFKPLRSTK